MSKISEAQQELQGHWNNLQVQWEATRQGWRDEMGNLFEREFWSVWEEEMPRLLRAMENFDHAVEQGLRGTSDP